MLAAAALACGGGTPAGPSTLGGNPAAPGVPADSGVRLADDFEGRRLLPADNWWNQEIDNAPLDPQSDAFIDFIGRTRQAHPDFGPPPYGIPYVGVGGSQPRVAVAFVSYPSESDAGFGGDRIPDPRCGGDPARVHRREPQTHGLIVADNGSDLYVTGAMDARWNNSELNPAFHGLTASDFEVVQLGWR